MSGPIILLRQGPGTSTPRESNVESGRSAARTWAELAWLLIGIYWIVLGLLVIPTRLQTFNLGDATLFGLVPAAVALGFRLFGPKPAKGPGGTAGWTHGAAVSLLATWPIAWVCLIFLGGVLR
jgi:hypothetical protein